MKEEATPTDQQIQAGARDDLLDLRVACILEQAVYKPGDQAPDGYLAWHEWAEVQHKAGLRQKQCGKCGLWRYPQELSGETIKWQGITARGRRVDQMAPLCLRCETPNGADEQKATAREA
jgi:hypothetical protein